MWSDQIKAAYLSETISFAKQDEEQSIKQANIRVYDEAAKNYEAHVNEIHNRSLRLFKDEAFQSLNTQQRPRSMVDIGCSVGVGLEYRANEFDTVIGLDISFSNLLILSQKGFLAVLGDAENLPFARGTIDIVTCFAAMHHFPNPKRFIGETHRVLKKGGVTLTAGDPSTSALQLSGLARLVWNLRLPVYRVLSRFSKQFLWHTSKEFQRINDLAEYQRTNGGFSPDQFRDFYESSGFDSVEVMYDHYSLIGAKYGVPYWKTGVLKALSFQNPFRVENWASLGAIAIK